MGLIYVDPVVHYEFPADTRTNLIDSLETVLVAAGWTTNDTTKATATFTITGSNPTNGQTVTIDGQVYTYKTSAGAAPDVQIGATAGDTLDNLIAAVNSVQGASLTATKPTGTTMKVEWDTGGTTGNNRAVSTNTGYSWNHANLQGGGNKMDAPVTSQKLQGFRLVITDEGEVIGGVNAIHILVYSTDETIKQVTTKFNLNVTSGRRLRAIASPAGIFVYLPGASTTGGCNFQASQLEVADNDAPLEVIGVASSGGLVEITTATPHGLTTGQQVAVNGIFGATGGNGVFNVTVTGSDTFTLDGSTFGGSYTTGGAVAAAGKFSQCFFACGDQGSGTNTGSLRTNVLTDANGGTLTHFVCTNQFFSEGTDSVGVKAGRPYLDIEEFGLVHESGPGVEREPWMRWNKSDVAATSGKLQGVIPNALLSNQSNPASDREADEVAQTADVEYWYRYTDNNGGNGPNGQLCLRTPGTAGSPPTAVITML